MGKALHPSLARLYACPEDAEFLFIDESVLDPREQSGDSFYILTASKYQKRELAALRQDLIRSVDPELFPDKFPPYWHSTEALQTQEGREVFEDLLAYLFENRDPSIITCMMPIPTVSTEKLKGDRRDLSPTENARRECLKVLFKEEQTKFGQLHGVIFEKRRTSQENDRDKRFLKALENKGIISSKLGRAWVTPRDEIALWVPDIVSMAYRRTKTHADETSTLFSRYLEPIVTVYEFPK